MPWLTPSDDLGVVYRVLAVPTPFLSQVNGALLPLEAEWNWEEYGDMTPEECAQAMSAMIDAYFEGNMLIGMMVPYAGGTIPTNCLLCDGSSHNRVDYPALYAVLADAYKTGPDTFITPPTVGRVIVGTDENEGETGGEAVHTLTADEMPNHSHADSGHTHSEGIAAPNVTTIGLEIPEPTAIPALGNTAVGWANLQSTGGGQPHNNMQPGIEIPWLIIAK